MNTLLSIMEKILAESYALQLKTQNYHWNVKGSLSFYALHKLFEEQYKELVNGIDEIAEQIRKLGRLTQASFSTFQKLSSIEEGNPSLSAAAMVKALAEDQDKLIRRLNEGIKEAQTCSDEGTADLLIARIRVHTKHKWMLESSL